ncbi:MAG: hypothetical protein ACYCQJ_12660 [Nitrososphaerales archaeon]
MQDLNSFDLRPSDFTPVSRKIIRHVFQTEYTTEKRVPGLGDFLRGCFALYQICQHKDWEIRIVFNNHPYLSKCFEGSSEDDLDWRSVVFVPWRFQGMNYLLRYLESCPGDVSVSTNMFAKCYPVTCGFQTLMRQALRPTKILQEAYASKVTVPPKTYGVLHLRLNDDHRTGNEKILDLVEKQVWPQIKADGIADVYLISSDKNIRVQLVEKYGCKTIDTTPTHLGVENHNLETVLDTMVDFLFMGNAQIIYQASINSWGSGFSEWCAKIYNVPLKTFCL